MDIQPFLDRLHDDESLTDNLTDEQATPLLAWGEARLEKAATDDEAREVIETIRRINRCAGEGVPLLIPPDEPGSPDPDQHPS
ncbi:MAG: hypothetical protein JWQ98_811 [Chlorobi bacterium]|nr:hypothetical protein [Chlorobiota bacterium]